MKKIASFLLVICLLCTTFFSTYSNALANSSEVNQELIVDGTFDSVTQIIAHNSSKTDVWMQSMASPIIKIDGENTVISLSTDTVLNTNNKVNSILLYGLGTKIESGVEYKLSFDMKVVKENASAPETLGFYLNTSDIWSGEDTTCQKDFYVSTANQWEHKTHTFTPKDGKYNLLRFQVNAGYEVYIDNISLMIEEKEEFENLIDDSEFNVINDIKPHSSFTNDIWMSAMAVPTIKFEGANKLVSLTTENSTKGNSLLLYCLGDKIKSGTKYQLSFDMKVVKESENTPETLGFYLNTSDIWSGEDATCQKDFYASNINKWERITYNFMPTDAKFNLLRFQVNVGYEIYIDNIVLTEYVEIIENGELIYDSGFDTTINLENYNASNPDVWSYGYASWAPTLTKDNNNNVISLHGTDGIRGAILTYVLSNKFKANTNYRLTFSMKASEENKKLQFYISKASDINDTQHLKDFYATNDWKTYSFDFSVTDDIYNMLRFQTDTGYQILLDNISLKEVKVDDDETGKDEFEEKSLTVTGVVSVDSLDFGKIEPASVKIDNFVAGESVATMDAVPYVGSTFVGWYKDEACSELISTSAKLEYFPEKAEDITVYAKFKSDNLIGQNFADSFDTSNFESEDLGSVRLPISDADLNNSDKNKKAEYSSNQSFDKLSNTITVFKNDKDSYGKWLIESVENNTLMMSYADFEDLQVVSNPLAKSDVVNNSAKSIYLSTWYRSIVRRVDGFQKGKTYLISFDYYTLAAKEGNVTKEVLKAGITNDYDVYFKDTNDAANVYYHNNKWSTGSFLYTHTDSSNSAYLRFESTNYSGGLYLDNFCVFDVTEENTVAVSSQVMKGYETYGTVSVTEHIGIAGNQMAVVANPFGTFSFEGWFDEEGNKKSNEQVYIFTPSTNIKLFAKFNVVRVDIISGKGGSVSGTASGYYEAGTKITVHANPIKGNTFAGWYDSNTDVLLSSDETYSFAAYSNTVIIAKFVGDNIEARDILNLNSFEDNKNLGNWTFFDDSVNVLNEEWCSMLQSSNIAYSGKYSLKASAPYRDVTIDLGHLEPNTDYLASFYIYLGKGTELLHTYVLGGSNVYAFSTGEVIATGSLYEFVGDATWHKVIMPFNSGAFTNGKLGFEYTTLKADFYIDDLQLIEYRANTSVVNPEFNYESDNWFGNANVTSDGIAEIAPGESVYQYIQTNHNAEYKLTYKVKANEGGELLAGIYNPLSKLADYKELITSYSYDKTTNTVWEEHDVVLFASDNNFVKIMFTNTGTQNVFIDSVTMVNMAEAANGKVEVIDFENGRYTIEGSEQQKSFQLNNAPEYVHSGETSLRYIHNDGVNAVLEQLWKRLPLYTDRALKYTLTMYVKTAKGNQFHISPDSDYKYVKSSECTVTATKDDWMLITYEFINTRQVASIDFVLKNISQNTKSDVYIDDISLQCTSAYIENTNVKELYCTELYNKIKNPDFEKSFTENDWENYIPENRVVDGDAHSRDKFLRLKAGDRFVVPVNVEVMSSYIFAVSLRSVNGGKGSVSLAVDGLGNVPLYSLDKTSKSIINATSNKWKRFGFAFNNGSYNPIYLVLECTSGSIEVDALAIFKDYSKYKENPYNLEPFKQFDYTAFLTGAYDNHNPNTGDFRLPLSTVMYIAIISCGVILVLFRRKEIK